MAAVLGSNVSRQMTHRKSTARRSPRCGSLGDAAEIVATEFESTIFDFVVIDISYAI